MDPEQIQQDNSEFEVLEYLTQYDYLEGPAHGIALQVMDKGRESLKGNQVAVFERIEEEYFQMKCRRCQIPMPTCEVVAALAEDDGLCSWCRKMESNDD